MQQFVRVGVSNAVWMFGKDCEAATCRVVVARGGHAQQTMGREATAASLAGLHGRGLVQAGLWAGEVEAEAGVDASTGFQRWFMICGTWLGSKRVWCAACSCVRA